MFKIIHVSDLHLQPGWHEEQGLLLEAFFRDLQTQSINRSTDMFVFSGDLVRAGSSHDHIAEFERRFAEKLEKHFVLENRLFCPGNHDIDRDYVKSKVSLLLPLADKLDAETQFNTNIAAASTRDLIAPKFAKIFECASRLFGASLSLETMTGAGFRISPECSAYILNTALYSFGGIEDESGQPICDKHRLRIETRKLRAWISSDTAPFRVLITHHPAEWLVGWAQRELELTAQNNFDLFLYGHEHSPDTHARTRQNNQLIISSSPALHTTKMDRELGYSIISIDSERKAISVSYRQWVRKDERFVAGTMFSGTDNGILSYSVPTLSSAPAAVIQTRDNVSSFLKNRLQKTIGAYKSLSQTWCEPRLSKTSEFDTGEPTAATISADDFLKQSRCAMIYAPQHFGLSTLGQYLCTICWDQGNGKYLLYFLATDVPAHDEGIQDYVDKELERLGLTRLDLSGFVIDSTAPFEKPELRRVNGFHKAFPDKNMYMLQRLPTADRMLRSEHSQIDFDYDVFYLLSLDRGRIRSLVRAEAQIGAELDEDYVTQRVAEDLDVLNIHRTPLHVKTLLAITKQRLDSNPINRTEMLGLFLLIVFQNNINLRYETIPDLKDSCYALGMFCAELLRTGERVFSKRAFLDKLNAYCSEKAVDLDVEVIFSILARERIIVEGLRGYYFHYTYWIYFFAAHHMYTDPVFKEFVLADRQYANFPEVIEYYSGIDRHREDLVTKLTSDLEEMRIDFERRSMIPSTACLHYDLRWEVNEKAAEKLSGHLNNFLQKTELPTTVKDQIADRNYNYSKPYIQELRHFINGDTLANSMHMMIAAARALRNSDHVDKEHKHRLLLEILYVWKRFVQIGTLLAPDIARNRRATYEDVVFISRLKPTEGAPFLVELGKVLCALPPAAAHIFHSDLSTKRMGPLLMNVLAGDEDELFRFFVAVQIILSKPKHWTQVISDYVVSLNRNSYFLLATFNTLSNEYRNGFNSLEDCRGLEVLLSKVVAKHELKIDNPNKKTMQKITTEIEKKLGVDKKKGEE